MIDPRPPNPSEFLWRHLELDLQQLGRALGRSADDAALFMHLILHNLLTPQVQGKEEENLLDLTHVVHLFYDIAP